MTNAGRHATSNETLTTTTNTTMITPITTAAPGQLPGTPLPLALFISIIWDGSCLYGFTNAMLRDGCLTTATTLTRNMIVLYLSGDTLDFV